MLCSLLSRTANLLEASNCQSRDSKYWCLLHALPRLRSKRDACRKAITIFSSNNSTAIGKKSGTHFYLHPTVPKGTGEKVGWRQAGTRMHRGEGRLQAGRQEAGRLLPAATPASHTSCLQAEPPQTRGRQFRVQTCACFFVAKITGVRQPGPGQKGISWLPGRSGSQACFLLSSPCHSLHFRRNKTDSSSM